MKFPKNIPSIKTIIQVTWDDNVLIEVSILSRRLVKDGNTTKISLNLSDGSFVMCWELDKWKRYTLDEDDYENDQIVKLFPL